MLIQSNPADDGLSAAETRGCLGGTFRVGCHRQSDINKPYGIRISVGRLNIVEEDETISEESGSYFGAIHRVSDHVQLSVISGTAQGLRYPLV